MPDQKLSALASFGTTPDLFYGEEGGVSKKYSGYAVYNVKDKGAFGDNGVHDDTTAIQAAVDAALSTGGIVFFPPGQYKVGRAGHVGAIHFPGQSNAGIRLIGCGINSAVYTNNTQYVFDIDYETISSPQIDCPVASFEYLSIRNQDGSFAALTSTETCAGGIHISGGGNAGKSGFGVAASPRIHSCGFSIVGGIGIFSAAQNMTIDNCFIAGGYSGTNASRCIGFFANNASIRDCKVVACGYGVIGVGSGGGAIDIADIDFEVCGTAICVGYSPCAFLTVITV